MRGCQAPVAARAQVELRLDPGDRVRAPVDHDREQRPRRCGPLVTDLVIEWARGLLSLQDLDCIGLGKLLTLACQPPLIFDLSPAELLLASELLLAVGSLIRQIAIVPLTLLYQLPVTARLTSAIKL
jgi:hypothetical protein